MAPKADYRVTSKNRIKIKLNRKRNVHPKVANRFRTLSIGGMLVWKRYYVKNNNSAELMQHNWSGVLEEDVRIEVGLLGSESQSDGCLESAYFTKYDEQILLMHSEKKIMPKITMIIK